MRTDGWTLRLVGAIGLAAAAVLIMTAVPMAQNPARSDGASANQVTFSRDVAPIMQRSCQVCHRPGQIGPMSLLTYENVRPWARAIRQKVSARAMPPWGIDKTLGIQKFKNDESLSDAEIDTIVRWADAGAPEGNRADLPPARAFGDGSEWYLDGPPDFIVKARPVKIPAVGPEMNFDMIVESGLTEDRYIKAIQTKPSVKGHKAIHHVLATALSPDDEAPDMFLNEFSAGKNADEWAEGTAIKIMAGAQIDFQFHIHPVGEEILDQTELGLKFYPRGYKPARLAYTEPMGGVNGARTSIDLDIPSGQIVRHDGYTRLHLPGKLVGFQPHMHASGKRQCIELIYPNDTTEVLNCADWEFGWAKVYNWADDVQPLYPAGTIVHVITWHDNTAAVRRRYTLDPRNWIGRGSRTVDDMAFAHVKWFDLTEDEYQQEIKKRGAKLTRWSGLGTF